MFTFVYRDSFRITQVKAEDYRNELFNLVIH